VLREPWIVRIIAELRARAQAGAARLSRLGDYIAVVIGGDQAYMIPIVWAVPVESVVPSRRDLRVNRR